MTLLIAMSCDNCNQIAVQILDREPTNEDGQKLVDEIGGMSCIRVRRIELELETIVTQCIDE